MDYVEIEMLGTDVTCSLYAEEVNKLRPSRNDSLLDISPCIDAGDSSFRASDVADLDGDGITGEYVPYDLNGDNRMVGDAIDMGAYEYQ